MRNFELMQISNECKAIFLHVLGYSFAIQQQTVVSRIQVMGGLKLNLALQTTSLNLVIGSYYEKFFIRLSKPYGGKPGTFFSFIFSHQCSALDHSAAAPPCSKKKFPTFFLDAELNGLTEMGK